MPDFDAELDQHPHQLLDEDQQTEIVDAIEIKNAASNRLYRIITLLFISIQLLSLLLNLGRSGNLLNLTAILFPLPSLFNTLTGRDLILLGLSLSAICLIVYRNSTSTRTVLALTFSAITENWMRRCEKDAQELHKLKYAQKSA